MIETKFRSLSSEEQESNPRIFDLAYHFYEGADPRAFKYCLEAGENAMDAFAMEDAVEYFDRAKSLIPDDADQKTLFRLWEKIGNACGKTRQFKQGLVAYKNVQPYASNEFERARAFEGVGEIHQWMGQYPFAEEAYDKALLEMEYSRARWLPRVLFELNLYFTICLFPFVTRARKNERKRLKAAYASRILQRFAQIYLALGDMIKYPHTAVKVGYTAILSGDADTKTHAFSKVAFNCSAFSLKFFYHWMMKLAIRCSRGSFKTI